MPHDHRDDELTVVTFSNETPAPPERRSAPRNLSVLRTALLRTFRGDELCLVRNISSGGLMAHIFSDLDVADPVTVEFKSDHSVRGSVAWRQDCLAGIQFAHPIELCEILSHQFESTFMPLEPRGPRAEVNVPGRIKSGGSWQSVVLRNISQGGARLQLGKQDDLDTAILLAAPGLAAIPGTIRWHDAENAGMAFDRLIPFPEIARWVADSHREHERAGSLPTQAIAAR